MSETSKGSKGNRYMRPCRGCGGSGGSFAHAYAQPGCNCPTCGGPVCPVCLGSGTVDDTPTAADALADAEMLRQAGIPGQSPFRVSNTLSGEAARLITFGGISTQGLAASYAKVDAHRAFRACPGLRA